MHYNHTYSFTCTTAPGNLQSTLCFWVYLRFQIQVKSYNICHSVFGLFHMTSCPSDPPMLSQMTGFHYYIILNNIPLCIHIYIYNVNSSVREWMITCVSSSYILIIVNRAERNIWVQISLSHNDFNDFIYILYVIYIYKISGIAGTKWYFYC